MSKKIKIAIYQGIHGQFLPDQIVEEIKKAKVDLICLPEYLFYGSEYHSILPYQAKHDKHLDYLKNLSTELNSAITGATLLCKTGAGLKNRCYFIDQGVVAGFYDKIHPFKNEGDGLVVAGNQYKVIGFKGIKIGLLVCADVLYRSSYMELAKLNPDLIIVPVTSPFISDDSIELKKQRDYDYFIAGAKIASCPVIKVSSVGKIAGHKVQGRSLIASPDTLIFKTPYDEENKPLLKIDTLDFDGS